MRKWSPKIKNSIEEKWRKGIEKNAIKYKITELEKKNNFTIRVSILRRTDQNPKLPRVKEGQIRLCYWTEWRNNKSVSEGDTDMHSLQNLCVSQNTGDVSNHHHQGELQVSTMNGWLRMDYTDVW